jgi:hypothetical protein
VSRAEAIQSLRSILVNVEQSEIVAEPGQR